MPGPWYNKLFCGNFKKQKGFDQEIDSEPRNDQPPLTSDTPQNTDQPSYISPANRSQRFNHSRLTRSKTIAALGSDWQNRVNSSLELDRTCDSSDYSYWSESETEEDTTLDSCELSSSNYTDNSDYLSFTESSAYTCELSTHNYTPNTLFSLNETRSEFSSTEVLNNSNTEYTYVSTVVKENPAVLDKSETSKTASQEVCTEMGNTSNKVEPAPEPTSGTVYHRSRRNSRVSTRSIRKNVSLLGFGMTPVCLGVAESTTALAYTATGSYEDKTVPSSASQLTQEAASLVTGLFRTQDVSSSAGSPTSSFSSLSHGHSSHSSDVSGSQDVSSSTSSEDSINESSCEYHPEEPVDSHSLPELPSVGNTLKSLHRSLEEISKCLDTYENNMEELSKLQDLSETFSSLDSSLESILLDEHELDELDSSFSSFSSFDSSADSFTYEPLNSSPTVHHQVKVDPDKSLEFLSTEKLLSETSTGVIPLLLESDTEVTTHHEDATPSKLTVLDRKSTPRDRKSFSCDNKKCNPLGSNDSAQYPKASTPVSKLLSETAVALTTYNPRTLFRDFSSSSSLESGCESQDSGYKTDKFSLSANTRSSSASSSTEKVSLVGQCRRDNRISSSKASSIEFLSSRSNSYEEISSFTGSFESCSSRNASKFPHCSYMGKSCPRITSLMYSPEKKTLDTPPPLPERPISPLRKMVAISNDTSMSSTHPFSSADSSTHNLYSSIHCLDISPTKPKKSNLFSKKLKSLKNLVKKRRSSCEVKQIGSTTAQQYAVPYKPTLSPEGITHRKPPAARVLQLL